MFRIYPKMKDSSVEWLGEVPTHWKIFPARHPLDERTEKNQGGIESEYLSLVAGIGVIPYAEKGDLGNKKPDDLEKCKMVFPGDFVLNSMNFGIGSFGISRLKGVCSPVYVVMRPKGDIARGEYLHRVFQVKKFQVFLSSFGRGIMDLRMSIGWEEIRVARVPLPPIEEQLAIASFLDRKTALIDELIAKRERQIELLQEHRAALINRAVTKGLSPDVPMKDSGVEWLGEVPEHWCIRRVKHLVLCPGSGIQMGPFGGMLKDISEFDTGVKLYGQENTISGDFTTGSRWIPAEKHAELACYSVIPGDILLTRKGSVGNARIFPIHAPKGVIDSDTIRLRVDSDKIQIEYLVRLLHESWYILAQIEATKRGAILAGLNTSTIAELRVVVPPIDEQTAIAVFLDRETAKIDTFFAKIRQSIEKLREYRTSLISAAVTGKIDVRNLAARPAAPEEPVHAS